MDKNLVDRYLEILNDNDSTENTVQKFLEKNSQLIPLPVLENHHLHMNAIISKFKLGAEAVTDFAYLTKSSVLWKVVLVELESPHKAIFKEDNNNIGFTAEFNNAIDQVRSWKVYVDENKESILKQIEKLRTPLENNKVFFDYVLVIGRNTEIQNYEKKRRIFAQRQEDEKVKIMTFDSLISYYSSYTNVDKEKVILSPWREQGFSIKELPKGKIETALFSYVYPDFLKVDSKFDERLRAEGYQIDEWKRGNLLKINNRLPDTDVANFMPYKNK